MLYYLTDALELNKVLNRVNSFRTYAVVTEKRTTLRVLYFEAALTGVYASPPTLTLSHCRKATRCANVST